MPYVYKQKFNIADLVHLPPSETGVVIYEPEEYLAALYGYHLQLADFTVKFCRQFSQLPAVVRTYQPQALLLNPQSERMALFKPLIQLLLRDTPSLKVITISLSIEPEKIKQLMASGVVSHIDRHLTQPRDVVHIVRLVTGRA